MKFYTVTGSFKTDITYDFHCEYCEHEYSEIKTLERDEKLSGLQPPTSYELLAAAQKSFKLNQDIALKEADRGAFRVNAKCPNCGFIPTFIVKRERRSKITILILSSLVLVGGVGPLFFISGSSDSAMSLFIALICIVPYLLFLGYTIVRINPNRKLMRALGQEGRSLSVQVKPKIYFGPVYPK